MLKCPKRNEEKMWHGVCCYTRSAVHQDNWHANRWPGAGRKMIILSHRCGLVVDRS